MAPWTRRRLGLQTLRVRGVAQLRSKIYPCVLHRARRVQRAIELVQEGHVIFTIPRDLTLSTRTSSLPSRLGKEAWNKYELDKSWAGLILCMLWEEAHGSTSKWSTYLCELHGPPACAVPTKRGLASISFAPIFIQHAHVLV